MLPCLSCSRAAGDSSQTTAHSPTAAAAAHMADASASAAAALTAAGSEPTAVKGCGRQALVRSCRSGTQVWEAWGLQNLPGTLPSICANNSPRPPRSQHLLSPAITQQPSTFWGSTIQHMPAPSNHPQATHSAGPGPCQRQRPPAPRSMHPSCPERSPQSTAGGRDGGSISGSRERSRCKQQGGWHRQTCAAAWAGSTRRDGGSMSSGTEHTCSATGRWQGSGSLRVHTATKFSPPSNSSHSRPPRQRCRPLAPAWCRTAPSGCRCAPGQARRWAPVGGVRSRRG